MSEMDTPISKHIDEQASFQPLFGQKDAEVLKTGVPLTMEMEGGPVQKAVASEEASPSEKQADPLEKILEKAKKEFSDALTQTEAYKRNQELPENLKSHLGAVDRYGRDAAERLSHIEAMFSESRAGVQERIAEAKKAKDREEVSALRAEMSEAAETLREIYIRHTLNIKLLQMPLQRRMAKDVEKAVLSHFHALDQSEMAGLKLESESVGALLSDELVRADTVQALLTETGIECEQEFTESTQLYMTVTRNILVRELQEKGLKNHGEGQDLVTLPAFLQSEGEESPATEMAIDSYRQLQLGFRILHSGKMMVDKAEEEFQEAKEKTMAAYRECQRLQKEEAPWSDQDEQRREWQRLCDDYFPKKAVRNAYSAARRSWIQRGGELGVLLNTSLTRAFAKAQEEFDREPEEKKKQEFREKCFEELSEAATKVSRVCQLFTRAAFDRVDDAGLKKKYEAVYDRLFQQGMIRLQKSAEALGSGEAADYHALLAASEKLIRMAGDTMLFLTNERKRLILKGKDDDGPDDDREEESEDDERLEDEEEEEEEEDEEEDEEEEEEEEFSVNPDAEYVTEDVLLESVNQVFDAANAKAEERRERQEKKDETKRTIEREEAQRELDRLHAVEEKELNDRKDRMDADALAFEDSITRTARTNQGVLKIQLTNRFVTGQDVLVPKKPLGRISAFTDAAGNKVKGVGKVRVFGEKIFGLKSSEMDKRIGKHVDRFLGSTGEITDRMLSDTASTIVEAAGLDSYAMDPRVALFQRLSAAKTPQEIKDAVEQAEGDKLLDGIWQDELEPKDSFYTSYPDARKTVMLYRIADKIFKESQGNQTPDFTNRFRAAANNLKKLREQIVSSSEYTRCRNKRVEIKLAQEGYQTDVTRVQNRMAEVQSTLMSHQDAKEFKQALKDRNSAFEERVAAAHRSSEQSQLEDFHRMYLHSLATQRKMSEEQRKKRLERCIRDVAVARENDRKEREKQNDAFRKRVNRRSTKTSEEIFRAILSRELLQNDVFTNKSRFFGLLGKKGPEVQQLLRQNRDLLYRLILEQIQKDKPAGIANIRDISTLSRIELHEYAASIRERLLNLREVYTDQRKDWFSNPRFTERVFKFMLSGEGRNTARLLENVDSMYLDTLERDELMELKEFVLLEGECWDSMHFSVNLFRQKKSRGHSTSRSAERMNRMMDADDTVESLCRACGVKPPMSYYEFLAEHPEIAAEETEKKADKAVSKKKDRYQKYLEQEWLKQAEAEMAAGLAERTAKTLSEREGATDDYFAASRHVKDVEAHIAEVKDQKFRAGLDLEEAEAESARKAKDEREAELDLRTEERLYADACRERDEAFARMQAAPAPAADETEEETYRRERAAQVLKERYEELKAKAEKLEESKAELARILEEKKRALEEAEVPVTELRQRTRDLDAELAGQEDERQKTISRLEEAFARQKIAEKRQKDQAEKKPTPKDVVSFLTRKESQRKGSAKSRTNMLEYGVYRVGSRLMTGELAEKIHELGRTDFNLKLEKNALHFFRCRKLTRERLSAVPDEVLSPAEKEKVLRNLEAQFMRFETTAAYETELKRQLAGIQGKERDRIRQLSQRKDERLSVFRKEEYMAYLPLVPLLLKDDVCLERILCDSDEKYQSFLFNHVRKSEPYMELLSGAGIYNGLLDQYLLDFGEEILGVIRAGTETPDKGKIQSRFAEHYKKISKIPIGKRNIDSLMVDAVEAVSEAQKRKVAAAELEEAKKERTPEELRERAKTAVSKSDSAEPGIPSLDPMTLCTVILLTSGSEALWDKERVEEYTERSKTNTDTLRDALKVFLENERIEGKEKDTFLAGVEMMERTLILNDPEVYAQTLFDRLHRYRDIQKADFASARELTELQVDLNRYMETVREKKRDGRKILQTLRKRNAQFRRTLEGPELSLEEAARRDALRQLGRRAGRLEVDMEETKGEKNERKRDEQQRQVASRMMTAAQEPVVAYRRGTEYSEAARKQMDRIMALHSMLPEHGGLNAFYQDMIVRASVHAAESPELATELMTEDYTLLLNMINTDSAITEYARKLQKNGQLTSKLEEEMLRSGVFEIFADFATSTEMVYEKNFLFGFIDGYFEEAKGGAERLKVVIHDKGSYYGLGNTLSTGESCLVSHSAKPEPEQEQAGWKDFEALALEQKKDSSAARQYLSMGPEEKVLVAQLIVNKGVTLRESRTLSQRIYAETMGEIRRRRDEDMASTALTSMVEGYLTGMGKVQPPDYAYVMAVLNRTVEPDMATFGEAVRIVHQLQLLKRADMLPEPGDLAELLRMHGE